MSFTWNELVGLGIIQFLQDPELVMYFLKILGPMRRDFLDDEYRSFYLENPKCLDASTSHRVSSLSTRQMITFLRDDSILIHPMVDWRKGEMSYEEASTYFLNGGTLLECRSASLKERIHSVKALLPETFLGWVSFLSARGRQATLLMVEGGPGEGMPDPLPVIPLEKVELELRFI